MIRSARVAWNKKTRPLDANGFRGSKRAPGHVPGMSMRATAARDRLSREDDINVCHLSVHNINVCLSLTAVDPFPASAVARLKSQTLRNGPPIARSFSDVVSLGAYNIFVEYFNSSYIIVVRRLARSIGPTSSLSGGY